MDNVLNKVIKAVINEVLQVLPILGEFGSEVSYFISESRNFAEVNILSNDIKNFGQKQL